MQRFIEKRSTPQPFREVEKMSSPKNTQSLKNLQNLQHKSLKPKLKKINFEKDTIRKHLTSNSSDNVKICKPKLAQGTPLQLPPTPLCSKTPNLKPNQSEKTSRCTEFASLETIRERNISKMSTIDTVRSGGEKICNTFHSKMNFFQNLQSSTKHHGNPKILKQNPPNKFSTESETSENKHTLFVNNPGREYWTNGKLVPECVDQSEGGRVRKDRSGDEM